MARVVCLILLCAAAWADGRPQASPQRGHGAPLSPAQPSVAAAKLQQDPLGLFDYDLYAFEHSAATTPKPVELKQASPEIAKSKDNAERRLLYVLKSPCPEKSDEPCHDEEVYEFSLIGGKSDADRGGVEDLNKSRSSIF